MGILNKTDFKEIDLTKQTINYNKMEKLTLEMCFKYPNAKVKYLDNDWEIHSIDFVNENVSLFRQTQYDVLVPEDYKTFRKTDILISDCKLILRPLSSLTDEEKGRLNLLERRFPKMDDTSETFRKHYQKQSDYLRSINVDIDNLEEKGVAVYE